MRHRPQWPAAAQVEALLQHPVMEAPPHWSHPTQRPAHTSRGGRDAAASALE